MGRFMACYSTVLSVLILSIMASNCAKLSENGNGLVLYLHHYSFYAQKAMIAMFEKKLPFKQEVIDITSGENYKPAFLKINPRGEVPVLMDGVKIIPDSGRIIDYLEDNFSNEQHPRLVPQDPAEKQKMNTFRDLIDQINGNTVTTGTFYHPEVARNQKIPFIYPVRVFMKAAFEKTGDKLKKVAEENPEYKEILLQKVAGFEKTRELVSNKESFGKYLDQIDQTLSTVETELSTHKDEPMWLVSKDFTVADVVLTILLDRLHLIGLSHKYWEGGVRPKLADYYSRVQHRDSYKKTVPGIAYFIKEMVGYKAIAGITAIAGTILALAIGGGIYCWRRNHITNK